MSEQAAAQYDKLAPTTQPFLAADAAAVAGSDVAQFITFAIGDEHYGIDIMAVREIKDWTAIRHLPNQPDYVRGICSLRGAFIPIVDLRFRFGQGLTEPTAARMPRAQNPWRRPGVRILQKPPVRHSARPAGDARPAASTGRASACRRRVRAGRA